MSAKQFKIFAAFIVSLAILLSACGPTFQVKEIYTPPDSTAGMACVGRCQTTQVDCDNSCNFEFQECSKRAENDARATVNTAMKIYDAEMVQYQRQNELYERSLSDYNHEKASLTEKRNLALAFCKQKGDAACTVAGYIDTELKSLHNTYYGPGGPLSNSPAKPVKPSLESEANMLRNKRCTRACNCKERFNQCYQQCGGKIEYQRICVKGCD